MDRCSYRRDSNCYFNKRNCNQICLLQITIPNEFQKLCPINLGFTAGIETDRVAPVWLQKGNEMDKILVVSHHAKSTYERTSVTLKDGTGISSRTLLLRLFMKQLHLAEVEDIPDSILDMISTSLLYLSLALERTLRTQLDGLLRTLKNKKLG
jgi:hypothetical protein